MNKEHSFFICEEEFVKNKEKLVKELAEKIFSDFTCIYCFYQKRKDFGSFRATQLHMLEVGHCMMNPSYLSDYKEFYDYSKEYQRLIEKYGSKHAGTVDFVEDHSDRNDEWEDIEEESVEEKVGEENVTSKKQVKDLINKQFRRNELGELVLPNNKILGTRKYLKYYQQHFTNYQYQRGFLIRALENGNIINPKTDLMVYNDLKGLKKIYQETIMKTENRLKTVTKEQNRLFEKQDRFYNKKLLKARTRKDRLHNFVFGKFYVDRNMCTS